MLNAPLPEKFDCPECDEKRQIQYFTKDEANGIFKVWLGCTSCNWESPSSAVGNHGNDDSPSKLAKKLAEQYAQIH